MEAYRPAHDARKARQWWDIDASIAPQLSRYPAPTPPPGRRASTRPRRHDWDSRIRVMDRVIPPYDAARDPYCKLPFQARAPAAAPPPSRVAARSTAGPRSGRAESPAQASLVELIERRERERAQLLAFVRSLREEELVTPGARREARLALVRKLIALMETGLVIVERVRMWRRERPLNETFLWQGVNYLLKMGSDLDELGLELRYDPLLWRHVELLIHKPVRPVSPVRAPDASGAAEAEGARGRPRTSAAGGARQRSARSPARPATALVERPSVAKRRAALEAAGEEDAPPLTPPRPVTVDNYISHRTAQALRGAGPTGELVRREWRLTSLRLSAATAEVLDELALHAESAPEAQQRAVQPAESAAAPTGTRGEARPAGEAAGPGSAAADGSGQQAAAASAEQAAVAEEAMRIQRTVASLLYGGLAPVLDRPPTAPGADMSSDKEGRPESPSTRALSPPAPRHLLPVARAPHTHRPASEMVFIASRVRPNGGASSSRNALILHR